MLVDTHCHLNFKAFEGDLDLVILRAKKARVDTIIVPGAAIDSSLKAIELAARFEGIYATVGIHPHHVEREGDNLRKKLFELLKNKGVVGIGETGLDYYRRRPSREIKKRQKNLFKIHLEVAKKKKLPVVIHNREAGEEVLKIIEDLGGGVEGVFHCFSENENYLWKVIEMGFYVGIDGNVTYNKSLREIVKKIPLEKLLLETDAPFLTPVPYRGLRNEPGNVRIVAKEVAELKRISFEEIVKETGRNAKKLFKI
jgi:TatD DNase family protein